jgi:hypothetical protein
MTTKYVPVEYALVRGDICWAEANFGGCFTAPVTVQVLTVKPVGSYKEGDPGYEHALPGEPLVKVCPLGGDEDQNSGWVPQHYLKNRKTV